MGNSNNKAEVLAKELRQFKEKGFDISAKADKAIREIETTSEDKFVDENSDLIRNLVNKIDNSETDRCLVIHPSFGSKFIHKSTFNEIVSGKVDEDNPMNIKDVLHTLEEGDKIKITNRKKPLTVKEIKSSYVIIEGSTKGKYRLPKSWNGGYPSLQNWSDSKGKWSKIYPVKKLKKVLS